MLPVLFGLTRLILVILLGAYAFGIFKSKTNGFIANNPHIAKIVAVVCAASGLYTLLLAKPSDYEVGGAKNTWTDEDKSVMVKNCLRDSKEMAIRYPQAMGKYCDCSVGGIMANISKEDYLKELKKPFQDQVQSQMPYFKVCLEDLRRATEGRNKER